MEKIFVVTALAAFGVLCLFWVLFGWMLPVCSEGWLLCPGRRDTLYIVNLFLWLRESGLIKCPLIVLDIELEEKDRKRLTKAGILLCSASELTDRLGIGAEEH